MVNKNVISKLSDRELEKYIEPTSRSVSDAVKYAYEILLERGRTFTLSEIEQIEALIAKKKENEQVVDEGWDKGLTADVNAIELYTNTLIWMLSVIFGVFFGGALQVLNFIKIKNIKGAGITAFYSIIYVAIQLVIINYISRNYPEVSQNIFYVNFILSGIGATGLFFIRQQMFPNDLQYRAKSSIVPVIASIAISIVLFYLF
ncbi:hypothetical protein [Sphingobacterium sp.]|uniref:hypothetical protein n=1 Tax=Sphingobacterium sp. TaxID=341027 RepID=UPI00289F1A8B|nr:hypothetical protein [Sphingobacterium sp.]